MSDFRKFLDEFAENRTACNERGYHRVCQDEKDPLICYDCDLYFGKDEVDSDSYRVEPL